MIIATMFRKDFVTRFVCLNVLNFESEQDVILRK